MYECPKCGAMFDLDQVYAEPWGDDSYVEYLSCSNPRCGHEWQRVFNYAYTDECLGDRDEED